MRVLGVDPGLTRCGLGVVDGGQARRATLVEAGVVRTSAQADVADRLCAVQDGVLDWLARHRPDAVAVERVFSQANVRTVMGTAQAGAVAIVAAARAGLPVGLYTPSEVKAAVTGSGRADKAQVAFMIRKLLELEAAPRPADAADAVALALCHLWRGPALARVQAAVARGAPAGSAAQAVRRAAPAVAVPAVPAVPAASVTGLDGPDVPDRRVRTAAITPSTPTSSTAVAGSATVTPGGSAASAAASRQAAEEAL